MKVIITSNEKDKASAYSLAAFLQSINVVAVVEPKTSEDYEAEGKAMRAAMLKPFMGGKRVR